MNSWQNHYSFIIVEVSFDHSWHLHIYVENIAYKHFNDCIFICFEVFINYLHHFSWIIFLLRVKTCVDFSLFLLELSCTQVTPLHSVIRCTRR